MSLLSTFASNAVSQLSAAATGAVSAAVAQLLGNLGLQQHARLIRLEGTPLPVLVERFEGREGLDQLFRFDVDVIAELAGIDASEWLGREFQLSLIDAAGQTVPRHGRVAALQDLGSDGGFSRYRLTLLPWAAWLDSRQDCWVFQDKTVLEIASELLADYPEANWRHSVSRTLRKRSLCIQYQESDWAFLSRLLAEEGLNMVFEHSEGETDGTLSRCQLHVFDQDAELKDVGSLRFGQISASFSDDRLTAFEHQLSVQPRSVQRSSWDYRQLHAPAGTAESRQADGEVGLLEDYDGSAAYRFDNAEHAARHAELRQLAHDGRAERFSAEGAVRALRPAQRFTLLDHADYSGRAFVVRQIHHQGANNLEANVADWLQSAVVEAGSYRHQLECQAVERPLVPDALSKPSAQPQHALVVGIEGEPLRSDRNHRIKIQFAWQRGQAPNGGGLAHAAGDNAPGSEAGFTWVRVAEWLAGPNWGTQFTPRVGDEVLIDFMEGDVDRPMVVGSLYNDQAIPPYAAGHDGPANHAGHLSGFHSQTLDGADYSRWVMDDTPGQLRSQLKTSRQETELNLGHLVTQPAFGAYRGRYRGEGFELRSDGWGSLRGEAGLLFSSHAQPQASDSQLITQATQSQAKAAEQLAQQLGDSTLTHQALANHGQENIAKLHARLSEHAGAVNGQAAQKPDSGGDGRQLKDPVETLQDSPAVLESPSALAAATEGSNVLYAGSDLQASSHADAQLTGQQTMTVQSGNRLSLFTHHGGMKLIAAEGELNIAAHTDLLHLASEQALTITSTEDSIHIVAKDSVKLFGGGAEIELKGGDITFKASGTFEVKGNSGAMGGAKVAGTPLALPVSQGLSAPAPATPQALVAAPPVVVTEVAAIQLDTALDDGSANDGTGKKAKKGLVFGKTYTFSVQQYTNGAPANLSSVKWQVKYQSPAESKNQLIEKTLSATGDKLQLKIEDKDMCGTDVTVTAYIVDPKAGGSLTHFQHNRFRWFDAQKVAAQLAIRKGTPWRIDQGNTSLCGMAALYYVMAKQRPDEYEKLAKELHRTGEFEIRGYVVKPNQSAEEKMYATDPAGSDFKNLYMPEVDWIVLASSRSGESNFGYDGMENGSLDQLKAVNWPSMLKPMLKSVAGFKEVESEGLSLIGLPIKKSPLGKLHDWASNSDLEDLQKIDRQYRQGHQILLMVDMSLVGGEAGYSTGDLFTESHWVVYEGGLRFENALGQPTSILDEVSKVYFNIYTWGTDPKTAIGFPHPAEQPRSQPFVQANLINGISTSSWKSNYYGYFTTK